MCENFAQEKGLKALFDEYGGRNNQYALSDYVDFIYGSFIANPERQKMYQQCGIKKYIFDNAIEELNERLKQHSIGFVFSNGQMIKKSNTMVHENIIKPVLYLLSDEEFRGAEEEYLMAFEHYKNSNNKEAISSAAKAFESTMKIICSGMEYEYQPDKDTARKLINILKENKFFGKFFPNYLDNYIDNVVNLLAFEHQHVEIGMVDMDRVMKSRIHQML